MRFLKKYFELKDETYLRAADRLVKNHPMRASKLRKWVDDKQDIDINYIDPRPIQTSSGVYYITNLNSPTTEEWVDNRLTNLTSISVRLESVNDVYALHIPNNKIELKYMLDTWGRIWHASYFSKTEDKQSVDMEFLISDRKSARNFMDIIKSETGLDLEFSINDVYVTD